MKPRLVVVLGMQLALQHRQMRTQRQAGFTLLEMMIVVSVMGTMAALLAPGVGEFLADAREAGATEDLVRLSRHIRARTQQFGLAHLLLFGSTGSDSGGLGRIRVFEGMNNHCRQTPWMQAIQGTVADGHAPVDEVNLGSSSYNAPTAGNTVASVDDPNRQVIRMVAASGATAIDAIAICYEPSGATWQGTSDGSSVGFAFTRQVLPITFTVSRAVNGEARGRNRQVAFQPGGIARFAY